MVNRRDVIGLSVAGAMALSILSAGVLAQKKDDKKLDDSQKKETQAVIKLADDVSSGAQQAPNDLGLTWVREDYLKAAQNKQYIPFIVSIDPSKVASGSTLTVYWRVVAKNGATATTGTTGKAEDKKDNKDNKRKTDYAYEDRSFVPVSEQGGPLKIARSFTVPAGTYDVYVVAKEPTSSQKNAPPPRAAVLKQSVTVPDFWNNKLNTSSIIVAQRIDPLAAPLTPEQQADRPYAMGAAELVPSLDNKISKSSEFRVFFLIYNPKTDANNKPNVMVEYTFCQAGQGAADAKSEPCKPGEKFFNKTNPLNLNADTLPPQFDIAAGHQLQGSQGVSLATFPAGDYRLEIKVTDKVANESLTRDVNFTVTAS